VDLSVVIPVYHGASTLPTLVPRLMTVLDQLGHSFEIILVDDGSKDGSWEVLRDLHAAYPDRVVVVGLMRNYGQHNALMAGFRVTRGELVVTMDEDLQHPPEEVPKLIEAIEARGLDLVYGAYFEKRHSGWRNLGSTLINPFYRMVFRLPVTLSAFRIIRRELLECIFSYSLNYTLIDGLLAWNTDRVGEVPVAHQPRGGGRSGYSLAKLVLCTQPLHQLFAHPAASRVTARPDRGRRRARRGDFLPLYVPCSCHHLAGLHVDHHRRTRDGGHPAARHGHHGRVHRALAPERQPQAAILRAPDTGACRRLPGR